MKRFQFSLERVLDWRSLQMRAAEEQLARLQEQHAGLVHREAELRAEELKAGMGLSEQPTMHGSDLQSLGAFQTRIRAERAELQVALTRCQAAIIQQRTRVLIARRDFRVLEKLKAKRRQAWVYLSDREIENAAAEAYLSRWVRPDSE